MMGDRLADLERTNPIGEVIDLVLDTLDRRSQLLQRRLQRKPDRHRLQLQELGARRDRSPVKVAGELLSVVHHAPEEALAGRYRSVLFQQGHRSWRELEQDRSAVGGTIQH